MSDREEKDTEPQSLDEEEEKMQTTRHESDLMQFAPARSKRKRRGDDDDEMSEQLRKVEEAKRRARRETASTSSAASRRRGKRTPNIGILVANAWREDEPVEDIREIASDEAGGGREQQRTVDVIISEVEREHGELDELEENPQTVYGMDIEALFRFCLQKGVMESDTRELMTCIGRIMRRVQRRRK